MLKNKYKIKDCCGIKGEILVETAKNLEKNIKFSYNKNEVVIHDHECHDFIEYDNYSYSTAFNIEVFT